MRMNKKIASLIAIATVVTSICTTSVTAYGSAAPDGNTNAEDTTAADNGNYDKWKEVWNQLSTDWTQVSMAPGSNETEMNFAWYSKEGKDTKFIYGKTADLKDGIIAQVTQTQAQTGYKSNKVTLRNLEAGTKYYYKVSDKSIESFVVDNNKDNFSFIFVGDPQIGSSNSEKAKKPEDILKDTFKSAQFAACQNDSFNWSNTLNQAMEKSNQNARFILSAGDQIQTNAKKVSDTTVSEMEYAGYLSPSVLRSIPVATTVGNHDADNENYKYHFNLPNVSELGSNGIVGGDYCFKYKNALFIMLNTQDTNVAEHEEFIKKSIEDNADCKWRLVTLHQDIYGSAEHSNEPEIVNLRYSLVPIFEKYDIDVVLTGHDHAYSRSQLLTSKSKDITYTDDEFDDQFDKDIDAGENPESVYVSPSNIKDDTEDKDEKAYLEYLNTVMDAEAVNNITKDKDIAVDPDGILYMTASSSSGSKYYDLVARKQTYIASRWQEDVPTYSVIDLDETTFTINTYRTDNNEPIDKQYTIVKSVEKKDLNNEITNMEGLKLDKSLYTTESFEAFEAALKGAKDTLANPKAKTTDVENALIALKSAYSSLKGKEDEKTANSNDDDNKDKYNENDNSTTVTKTGDTNDSWKYIVLVSSSLIIIASYIIIRRKKNA